MTTTEMIELLKRNEHGGATGRPRQVYIEVIGRTFETNITDISTGDGLFTELYLTLEDGKPGKWLDGYKWQKCSKCA